MEWKISKGKVVFADVKATMKGSLGGKRSSFENGTKGQVLILAVQPIINRKLKKEKYGKGEECSQVTITSTVSSKKRDKRRRKENIMKVLSRQMVFATAILQQKQFLLMVEKIPLQ